MASPADTAASQRVAVVNETFAQRYWPGQDAIGKHIGLSDDALDIEVIGVARDGKYGTLGEDKTAFFYVPLSQNYESDVTILVRTKGDPAAAFALIRNAARSLDSTLPIHSTRTMVEHLGVALFPAKVMGTLLGIFGGLALLLALIGIYGVTAFLVSQRTHEIGIRMALGARPADVLLPLLKQGARTIGIGLVIGLAITLSITQFLGSFLYDLSPTDPTTFATTLLLLGSAAFLASYIPASRATRVDPMVTLRRE
jgi:predicted permease